MPDMKLPASRLLDFQNAVIQLEQSNYGLYMISFSRIRQWYNDNGVRLESLKDRIKALQKEFLEFEGEKEERKIKFVTKESEPAVPAKYITKTISYPWYKFKRDTTEQVLLTAAIPEKKFQPEVIYLEGKTAEEFEKRYKALLDQEVDIKF